LSLGNIDPDAECSFIVADSTGGTMKQSNKVAVLSLATLLTAGITVAVLSRAPGTASHQLLQSPIQLPTPTALLGTTPTDAPEEQATAITTPNTATPVVATPIVTTPGYAPFPTAQVAPISGQQPTTGLQTLWYLQYPSAGAQLSLTAVLVDGQGRRASTTGKSIDLHEGVTLAAPHDVINDMHISPDGRWAVLDINFRGSWLIDIQATTVRPLDSEVIMQFLA
jgi:hypothetical protein